MIKLLTCETWVSRNDFYAYTTANASKFPNLLIDRSMCQDPFLDQYQPVNKAKAIISGLCRGLSNKLSKNDTIKYVTKVPNLVLKKIYGGQQKVLQQVSTRNDWYFGVAILRVDDIVDSHLLASNKYTTPRQFVHNPSVTPYPPNLAHNPTPVAAADISESVSYVGSCRYIGSNSTCIDYNHNYHFYHRRQSCMYKGGLKVAECVFVQRNAFGGTNPSNPRPLNPANAPLLNSSDWGNTKMNIQGIELNKQQASNIVSKF